MLETPHVAVGAAIAAKIPNPFIAIPLALASHLILDQVPHWNPHSYTEVKKHGKISNNTRYLALADVACALATGFFVASQYSFDMMHAITIILSCFAAVAPDVFKAPYFLLGMRDGIMKKWVDFERSLQVETNFVVGMAIQVAIIIAALTWIFS